MVGASLEGFRITVLPVTMEAAVMPAMMAKGKFQGGITAPTPSGMIEELVALAGILDGRGRRGQPQGFAGVKLEEVDGFADIGVGLGPVLAHFISKPGAKLELPAADNLRCAEEEGDPRFQRGSAPGLEGLERGLYGHFGVSGIGFLVNADDLSRASRVQGANLVPGLEPLAADDQVVFAAQLTGDQVQAACILRTFSGALKSVKGSFTKPPWGERG